MRGGLTPLAVEVLVARVVALMMVQMVMTTLSEQAMEEAAVAVMIRLLAELEAREEAAGAALMLVLAEMEAREEYLAAVAAVAVLITRVARLPQVAQAETELSGCGFTDERNN